MKKNLLIHSTSSLKKHARCSQLWEYTYLNKLQPASDDGSFEATYGSAFHSRIEGKPDYDYFGEHWNNVVDLHYACYNKYWSASAQFEKQYELLATEIKFRYTTSGYTFGGFLDGIARWNDQIWLVESKTTGRDLTGYLEKFRHKLQPGMYCVAAEVCPELQVYGKPVGIILDATIRPGIRQNKRKKETNKEYLDRVNQWYYDNRADAFLREPIQYTSEQLDDVQVELVIRAEQTDNTSWKNRDACYDWRRQCGFYDVCFNGEQLTNNSDFIERKKRK